MSIKFRKGFLYQIAETIEFQTVIRVPYATIKRVTLFPNGTLIIWEGYAWDGPSGPTKWINKCLPGQWLKAKWLKTILRGSAAHDALYELMRKEQLDIKWRPVADKTMLDICREDGMSRPRLWRIKVGLAKFAEFAALPENKKKILTAP